MMKLVGIKNETRIIKYKLLWRKWFWVFILLGILMVVCGVLFGVYLMDSRFRGNDKSGRGDLAPTGNVVVSRVVDGDTIEVMTQPTRSTELGGRVRVRLIGIDAPEISWIDRGSSIVDKNECFAEEAKEKLRELVEGKEVRLEKDVSEKDKYDRLLRYVYVGEENINEVLVREGFAKLATYPPDIKYYRILKESQGVAKENKSGLWNYCLDSGSSPE